MKRTYLLGLLGISAAATISGCEIKGIPNGACFPKEPCAQKYTDSKDQTETDSSSWLDTTVNDLDSQIAEDNPLLSEEEKQDVVTNDLPFSEDNSPQIDAEEEVSLDGNISTDLTIPLDQGVDSDGNKDVLDTTLIDSGDALISIDTINDTPDTNISTDTSVDSVNDSVNDSVDVSLDTFIDTSLDTLVLPQGPCLANYSFDGDFTNACANGPLAQNYGVTFVSSNAGLGQAVSFDGNTKIVFLVYNPGGKFTYSVYVKPADTLKSFNGTYGTILTAKNDAGEEVYALRIGDNNVLKAKLEVTTLAAIVPDLLPSKDAQKITVAYNGVQILLYVNDILQASKDVTYSGQKGNVLVSLGSDNQTESNTGNNFKGTLDEVVIMNDE